jgi:hypothetical protein
MPPDDALLTAARLDAIDRAARMLRETAARLTGLVARTASVATTASWHAPSARAFQARAEELRTSFARAEAGADDVTATLTRVRATIVARVVVP